MPSPRAVTAMRAVPLLLLLTTATHAAFFNRQRRPEVPEGGLTCDDGYTAVPAEHVNDDYCDCADGADEPRTAACSGSATARRFECADDGTGARRIPASRVGDGVCDCCDGNDERAGLCPDTCAAAAEAAAVAAAAAAAERRAGLARRAEYVERYKAAMADAEIRKTDAQRVLDETDVDGPRQKVADFNTEATAARDAAVARADAAAAAQRAAALADEAPENTARAAVALCAVADNMEALLEAVHEHLPSDSLADTDILALGAAAAFIVDSSWRPPPRHRAHIHVASMASPRRTPPQATTRWRRSRTRRTRTRPKTRAPTPRAWRARACRACWRRYRSRRMSRRGPRRRWPSPRAPGPIYWKRSSAWYRSTSRAALSPGRCCRSTGPPTWWRTTSRLKHQ